MGKEKVPNDKKGAVIVSLFFSALGVAFTKHGELGVSPISSVANVMSYRFPALSLGSWLILWNCIRGIIQKRTTETESYTTTTVMKLR